MFSNLPTKCNVSLLEIKSKSSVFCDILVNMITLWNVSLVTKVRD